MPIRRRKSPRAKKGYVYEVYFHKYNYYKSGFQTEEAAKIHEAEKLMELEKSGQISKDNDLTLQDLFDIFMRDCTKYKPNTMNTTRQSFKHVQNAGLHKKKVKNINSAMLQRFFDSRSSEGIATNRKVKEALNRIYDFSVKRGYATFNPCESLEVSGKENKRTSEKTISEEDFNTIISELDRVGNYRAICYKTVLLVCRFTGARTEEVLALKRSDIDFKNRRISINKSLVYADLKKKELYVIDGTKSESSQGDVPIALPLIKPLKLWLEINTNEYVFVDEDGYFILPKYLYIYVNKLVKDKGIHFGGLHTLRHTLQSGLYKIGTDLKTSQEILRHGDVRTTLNYYTHIDEAKKLEAIDNLFNEQD